LKKQVQQDAVLVPRAVEDLLRQGLPALLAVKDKEIEKCQQKYLKEAQLRRKLHNLVQELKGNIRVYCRVRPLLGAEKDSCIFFPEEGGEGGGDQIGITNEAYGTSKTWSFDRVFQPDKSQEHVFEDVQQLVVSMLDGYNICVFAYGQTGSGKTHSMQGTPTDPGIYLRTFREFFKVIAERGKDWKYHLTVSLLEVYNDETFDLLGGEKDRKKVSLRQAPTGWFIPDLASRPCNCDEEITKALEDGQANRKTGRTNMNEHSSRSHLIVQVQADITAPSGKKMQSKMNLIDLAGSERLKSSGAVGDRAKEAMHINKSLSSLGDVIHARASRSQHIPYLNSELTRLLQDSLGGESKTLMLLQCSPVDESVEETTCSLTFGARVNTVEMQQTKKK